MAWKLEDLEKIEQAIAQGARKVKYKNKEIEYPSIQEMMRVRDRMRAELKKDGPSKRRVAVFDKGL